MTTIEIDAPAGPIDALLGLPPGQGPWPGVVVVHDAVGYVPDNKLISERIARAGYVVLTRTCTPEAAAPDVSPESFASC